MSKVSITKSKLDNLAVSISTKSGAALPLTLDQMKTAVDNMSSGGTDTSDATLTSGNQMLSGYTAYADGTKYTGTIETNTQSDLTVSGATVTVLSGYYADDVSKSVASGSAGTPTATKGTVSNNSVSVTPSVTNTTGYITGSTKTGTAVTVSASELVSGTITITSNNTYDVTNYASAVVNVSGGGGGSSSWTLVASTSYQVSTTSSNSVAVATWATGLSAIWTSSAFVWVHIRDTAGKRNGYFYGSDTVFLNRGTDNVTNVGGRFRMHYQSDIYNAGVDGGTTGRGVYPLAIWNNGDIEIYARYSSTYSKTIDGTYSVEVYLLTPPFTIFE